MSILKDSLKTIILSALVLLLAGVAYGWTEPSQSPPLGNLSAPITISSDGQTKSGNLVVNSLATVNGLIVQNGNVGIGTTGPTQARLHVTRADGGMAIIASASSINGTAIEGTGAWGVRGFGNRPDLCWSTGCIAGGGVAGFLDPAARSSIAVYAADLSNGAPGNLAFLASGQSKFVSTLYPQISIDDNNRTFALGVTSSTLRVRDVTGAADRITVDSAGKVGIGTATPSAELHLAGSDNTPTLLISPNVMVGGNISQIQFADPDGGTGPMSIQYKDDARGDLAIIGGNVGIGMTEPDYTLTVNGTAWATSGAWSGSDIRWKKNIKPLENSLNKILLLQGVNYEWKKEEYPDLKFNNGAQIGFIAQDVEKVLSEVVTTDNNGYKGISYEKIVPVLTEAIKELKIENDLLKKRIEILEIK